MPAYYYNIAMRKSDKTRIQNLYFQIGEKLDELPAARNDIIDALRPLNVLNSNCLENKYLDPHFLQIALYQDNGRLKDHFSPTYRKAYLEVSGHQRMLRELEQLACARSELSVSLLLDLHRMLFESSWPDEAGRFRSIEVRIRDIKHRPPHYSQVSELAYQHLEWIDGLLKLLGPVTRNNFLEIFHVAADLHFRLIQTYPFRAGNWRIARSMADYILLYSGLFYNLIDCHKRKQYQAAITNSKITDISPLEDFLLKSFGETLNKISGYVKLLHQEARAATAE